MDRINLPLEAPIQPNNPTDSQRRYMTYYGLVQKCRPEDLDYVLSTLTPPPDITTIGAPGEFKGIRVGIIGGGLAGMSAAFELRKLGFDITVYEALEDRVGGRVFTYYFDKEKTLYGELGPMRIPTSHETVWHYINLFKLETRPFVQVNPNALIYLKKTRVRNDPNGTNVMKYIYPKYNLTPNERATPWQKLVYYALDSHLLSASPEVRSEIQKILPRYSPKADYWDTMSIRKIIESLPISQAAIDLVGSLTPLAGGFLYNNYIDFIQEFYPANFAFMYEIIGGLSRLPETFYESFKVKNPIPFYPGIPSPYLGRVTWNQGHFVTGVSRSKDGRVTLAYRNKEARESRFDSFDYVVCAIPFSTLRTMDINPLFSDIKMQAIREVTYVPAQKTLFLCKERFWEEGGPEERILGGGTYTDLPITTTWYPSDHAKYGVPSPGPGSAPGGYPRVNGASYAKEPGVLLASYNFNQDSVRLGNMEEKVKIQEIKKELAEVHGLPFEYIDSVVADYYTLNWNAHPWFRGAFCFFSPEQKRLFSFGMTLPEYGGRLYFAGEHISPTHRWMQGALKTGMDAANSIAASCRLRKDERNL